MSIMHASGISLDVPPLLPGHLKKESTADKNPIISLSVLDSKRLPSGTPCRSCMRVVFPWTCHPYSRGISRTSLQPIKTRLVVSPCLIRSACRVVPHVDHACEWYFLGRATLTPGASQERVYSR